MTKFVFPDLSKPQAVWWPVTIDVPLNSASDGAGTVEPQTLRARFVVATDEKISELLKIGQAALLAHVVVDWECTDEAVQPVPFERFAEISGVPYVGDGFTRAYFDFLGRAPRKN
ncbi:hypothetical protein sos41_31270 [Alphaproteobacteria bacterium SO-S41]|nr:hypothetical protein sos41_31270 [Alphaproteobacteria bacterium SO-S41]